MKIFIKRILVLFLIIFYTITLTACKKNENLDYMYVGIYLDILELEDVSFTDRNLKLYIDVLDNNKFVSENGIYEYQIVINRSHKIYEADDIKYYYLSANYGITNTLEEVKIYPIILKAGTYEILKTESKILKFEDTEEEISFAKEYKYQDEKYNFLTTIKIYKK